MTSEPSFCISVFRRLTFARVLVAAGTMCAALPAHAAVRKIQVIAKESPTFGGYSWPGIGQYEKIVGKAYGELDPSDPRRSEGDRSSRSRPASRHLRSHGDPIVSQSEEGCLG